MDEHARRRLTHRHTHAVLRSIVVAIAAASGPTAIVSDRSASIVPDTTTRGRAVQEVRTLEPGASVDRTIGGGECHRYRVLLDAGQLARVIVDQGARDLVVKVHRGAVVEEFDGRWHGPEDVSVRASSAGWHDLEICTVLAFPLADPYTVTVNAIEPFGSPEAQRLEAQRLASNAKQLLAKGTGVAFQSAIGVYEKALPLWRALGDQYGEAQTLNALGLLVMSLGNPARGLESYELALPIWQRLGYRTGEAETLGNMGGAFSLQGNKRLALKHHERALEILRAAGNRYLELFALNGIGTASAELGEPQKALEHFEQVRALAERIGDSSATFRALNNLGGVYDLLGEPQKALESYDRVLGLCAQTNDLRCEANARTNRGTLSRRLGDFDAALEQYRRGHEAAKASGDVRLQALSLQFMGTTYQELGQLESALQNYEQALTVLQKIQDRRGEGALRVQMGRLFFEQRAHDRALESYRAGVKLLQQLGDVRNEAQGHHGIALVQAAQGAPDLARQNLELALVLAAPLNDRQTQAEMLLSLARIERDVGALDEASQRIGQALDLVEGLRGKVNQQRLRISFLAAKSRYYETAIDVQMRLHERQPANGHDTRAFEISERFRARSLLDMLSELGANLRGTADPQLLDRERLLQERLSAKAQRQLSLGISKQSTGEAAEIGKEIAQIIEELEALASEIRRSSPRYATLTQLAPLSAADVQRELLDADTGVFEIALGEQQSYGWLVTTRAIVSAKLPPRAQIESAARRVYELVTARIPRSPNESAAEWARRIRTAEADYPVAVRALSQLLLGPFSPHLTPRLVVIPDGALQYVPFAALEDPRAAGSRPLIVDHEIVTLPSIATLKALRQENSKRPSARGRVAVLADPVVDPSDARLSPSASRIARSPSSQSGDRRSVLRASPGLEQSLRDIAPDDLQASLTRLKGAGREAEMIASLVPAEQRLIARGFDATRELATSPLLANYDSVHFATHGIINSVRPELSGLMLSLMNQNGEPQPGFLRAHEVYTLRLPVDLVVLSACRTGLGKELKGEGLVGLSRGFMYAGARRVAVSLWKIDDEATAELMGHFYRAMLREQLAPATALQRAQVAMWKGGRWRSPFYWAAFVVQGEWRR
jgi:CHAT domain-containing protein/Tfp pilus assembly protein PilF